MVLDWVLYFILYNFVVGHELVYITLPFSFQLCLTPHIMSLLIVFPITLFTGFWLNKYVTFTQSSLRGYKQLWRYILIVIVNLLVNYLGLKLLVEVCGVYPTPSKMIVTIITVVISFFGQKYFSFKK
jgi:putative flippase GtrA